MKHSIHIWSLTVLSCASTFAAAQTPPPIGSADIVVLMDESASMAGEQAWIRGVVPALEATLSTLGVVDNLYGLVGFGATAAGAPSYVRSFDIAGQTLGSASDWVVASQGLVVSGGTEDGWAAIARAAEYPLRPPAAQNFILITDEDRDNTNSSLSFASTLGALESGNILLNVVVNANFLCGDGTSALGLIGSTGYKADGTGGFTRCEGASASGTGAIRQQYVDLALASGGGAWNLNVLRSGGQQAQSFSQAFIDGKVAEILIELPPIPEPATVMSMFAGLGAVAAFVRRRRLG